MANLHQYSEEEILDIINKSREIEIKKYQIDDENLLKFNLAFISLLDKNSFVCNIELRDSPIHGKGIFATAPIKKGRIITFYPSHGVYRKPQETIFWAQEKFATNPDYKVELNKNCYFLGDPAKTDIPFLLGHMANDSACFEISDQIDDIEFRNRIIRYALSSSNNALFRQNQTHNLIYLVASRDIKKDEEIFVSYSPYYWLKSEEQNQRLQKLLKSDPRFKHLFYLRLLELGYTF